MKKNFYDNLEKIEKNKIEIKPKVIEKYINAKKRK